MSAFPTAASTIYRNEDGEVLGWDTYTDDAPEYEDFYGDDEPDEPTDDDGFMDEWEGAEDAWLDGSYEE
jgi:hypothetical protein